MAAIGSGASGNDGVYNYLKKTYNTQRIEALIHNRRDLLKKITKTKIDEGQNYTYPIGLTYGQRNGGSLSQLLAGTGGSGSGAALTANVIVNTANDYGLIELDNKFLARAKSASASFMEQLRHQVDSNYEGFGILMSGKLFGNGTPRVGATALTVAGGALFTTFTMTNRSAAKQLQPGSRIVFGLAGVKKIRDNTNSPDSGTADYAEVASVDYRTGVVTLTGSNGYAFTIANADSVGLYGVYFDASAVVHPSIAGLEAWIPLAAPSGTTVGNSLIQLSHDRGDHPIALAGHRLNDSTRPVEESMFILAQDIYEFGGMPDVAVMSINTYNKIAARQWNKIVPMDKSEAESMGNKSLALELPFGKIPFRVETDCPDSLVYLLEMKTWKIVHLSGKLPEDIKEASGQGGFFQTNDDTVQLRYRAWWNLVCTRPASNGVCSVSSTVF